MRRQGLLEAEHRDEREGARDEMTDAEPMSRACSRGSAATEGAHRHVQRVRTREQRTYDDSLSPSPTEARSGAPMNATRAQRSKHEREVKCLCMATAKTPPKWRTREWPLLNRACGPSRGAKL